MTFREVDTVLYPVLVPFPEKFLFPPDANTPPEHCLSCLLAFYPPFNSTFALEAATQRY